MSQWEEQAVLRSRLKRKCDASRNTRTASMVRGWRVSKKGGKTVGSETGKGPSGDVNASFVWSP